MLALLIGNIAATPVRALRHQMPHYMGIYSPKLGTKLLAIGQSLKGAQRHRSGCNLCLVEYRWLTGN